MTKYVPEPTSPDPAIRQMLRAREAARQAQVLAAHKASRDAERKAIGGDPASSPLDAAARGVRRFLARRDQERLVAEHNTRLEHERRLMFGADLVAFRAPTADPTAEPPISESERRRLLSMTQAGKDLLRNRQKDSRASTQDVPPRQAMSRAERDELLSKCEAGRFLIRKRDNGGSSAA